MASSDRGVIEFRLLGPIEAVRDGTALPVGGPRQRALLALLLLDSGRPVPSDRLVDDLWRGSPPRGATTTLRSYVSRLRPVLGGDCVITGNASGYVLDVPSDRIDVARFERLVEEGQEALERGAPQRAVARLDAALRLWRGRPFAGVGDDGTLRLEAERLDAVRLLACEERIEAELALGRSGEVVPELEALVLDHPFRERLWRQLMVALYRSERQADALEAYRRARTLFAEELGLEPSEELRRLEQAILLHNVPRARPPSGRLRLPAPLTSFIGRTAELPELERLLARERLVTLTGVGGVGKTRLAVEAATRVADNSPDGVYFADLAGIADPGVVASHVAARLEVGEPGEGSVASRVETKLRDADVLLVLDNCEHLRAACADLAQTLLTTAPRLRILATSREVLGVPGEIDYEVPPLTLPSRAATDDERASSEAVRLFIARAKAARPRLVEDATTVATAARICRDLDGLPLAIELAAARAKALSVDDIAVRLSDRFRFLVSWRRLTVARHRTLANAMDWSYELLADAERTLLARLSVFASGFTLRAVATVCLEQDESRALELVGRLVDSSLVVAEERNGEMRYRLFETVRDYAAMRLAAAGELEALRTRHSEWCLALAEEAEPELTGEKQAWWFQTLEAEHDNLRSALAHLAAAGDGERHLRLTVALSRFRYVPGYLTEARRSLELALAGSEEQPAELRRRALTAAAAIALLQGEYDAATAYAEASLAAARERGEPRLVANALSNLGAIVLADGDHERAAVVLEDAVALARDVGDDRIAALAINNLGDVALTVGDYERARPLFEESLALLQRRGDTANVARALFNVGAVDLQLGRHRDAERSFHESLALSRETDDKEDLAWCLEGLAGVAAADRKGERAAVLLGAAGALLDEMRAAFKPFERQLHNATEARARELCGAEDAAAAMAAGAAMPLPRAVELAADGGRA